MNDEYEVNEFTRDNAERAYNKLGELCDTLEKTRYELLNIDCPLFDLTLRRPRFSDTRLDCAKVRYGLEGVKNIIDGLARYLNETREILTFLQERF